MEGGLIVLARILFLTDFHKRYKDSTSIKGILPVQQKIQEEIISFIKANDVTHCISTGDWYDSGFHGLGPAYGSMEMDRRLSAAVNGNMYLCIGNHFYLERDENPEMYIIQPNAFIKPLTPIAVPDKPIFNMIQTLQIGQVQIDFFHYNKLNKNYVAYRNPNTTFHIGVYHDDTVVPGWVREQEGYTGASTQSYMDTVYNNIDLAIHGHIHTKIGMTSIQLSSGRKVPMFIPGALSITQNKECFKHQDVQLPLIDIDDDSTVHVKQATFSTHLAELKFYAPKKKKEHPLVTEGLIGKGQLEMNPTDAELRSLPVYLTKRGYVNRHLNLVNAALSDTLNLATAVRILAEVDEIHERTGDSEITSGSSE